MSFSPRTLGLAVGAALLAAACGTASTSTSPGAGATFPNVSPSAGVGGASATPELSGGTGMGSTGSTGGTASGGTASGGTASGPMTGDQLVGTIPTRIADMQLTVRTATPADLPLFDSATGSTLLSGLTSALGVDASRLSAAIGTSTNGVLTIGALNVPGADTTKLTSTLSTAFGSLNPTGEVPLGGKTVTSMALDGATVYVYATGSTLYFVKAPDDLVGEEALVALP